jgi:hypothetical protein
MKTTTLFTSLITATLLSASAFAGNLWGGDSNSEVYGHILNDLDKPAFVGTSMSMVKTRIDPYNGFTTGSAEIDQSGFSIGAADPEKGHIDNYGWAVLDVNR